jgi:starch synthase (maltosyl-transferring)
MIESGSIIITDITPRIDGGRFAVKRVIGDRLEVGATLVRDGHDRLSAVVRYRRPGDGDWQEAPMVPVDPGLDRWQGRVSLDRLGRWHYTVEAWTDLFGSWRADIAKRQAAGQALALDLLEGKALVEAAAGRAAAPERLRLARLLDEFAAVDDDDARLGLMLSADLAQLMDRLAVRADATRGPTAFEVVVDRKPARFAAWYEMFARSQGTVPGRSASFDDAIRRLPEIAALGFDVVYLPPIHPIGHTFRKGANNAETAGPADPGSPYAIGAAEGGHTAIHPDLGTLDDFRRFVAAASGHGLEVVLDIALQCSPDHPWIRDHPEWFRFRADGSIRYAENPPKKYQDIVNLDFLGPHRQALWAAIREVFEFWIAEGVQTFRIDNPHTKPLDFWEWLIRELQARHPEVIFLAEAFTRPQLMKALAKVGFTQSYTYFTWRTFKDELTAYLTELTAGTAAETLRPHFFTNTPDILPEFLQKGGRPAFVIRLVLAATLSSLYGIYNGFELCEATAIPGTEEYQDSEKYQYKVWDWDRPGHIKEIIAAINRIRRENPALHELVTLRFHEADHESVLFYSKMTEDCGNVICVAVNLDPFEPHEAMLAFPLGEIGLGEADPFEAEELLGGTRHLWTGSGHRLRLDPQRNPAAIYRIAGWKRVDYRTPCG